MKIAAFEVSWRVVVSAIVALLELEAIAVFVVTIAIYYYYFGIEEALNFVSGFLFLFLVVPL